MAKGKYAEWLTEDKLILLEGWAREGLSDEQIAHNMGIVPSTYYEWINKYSEIAEAIKKNKEIADYEVENALYKTALAGNVTAQMFWLQNRKPQKWRDMRKKYNDGDDDKKSGGVIIIAPVDESLIEEGKDE